MDRRVTILGAGFCKAVHDAMPLTDELGNRVLDLVKETPNLSAPRTYPGYFEAWLSRIAEDQPDLDPAANFFNRGLFEACRRALVEVLEDSEGEALRLHGSAAWFVSAGDRTGATLARRIVGSGWGLRWQVCR